MPEDQKLEQILSNTVSIGYADYTKPNEKPRKIAPVGDPKLIKYNRTKSDLERELLENKPFAANAYVLGGSHEKPSFDERVSPEVFIAVQYYRIIEVK
jgi:hypothetical protein